MKTTYLETLYKF